MSHQPAAQRSWLVIVPDPGPGWVSANGRLNHFARSRAVAAWRGAARQYALHAQVPRLRRAHVLATFHHPTARRRDAGNLAPTVKAAVDGLVDAHVLPDDDDAHLLGPDLRTGLPVDPGRPLRLALVITELALDDVDPLSTAPLSTAPPAIPLPASPTTPPRPSTRSSRR